MISPDDRGLLLGDGVFDTLRIESGRPLLLRRHLDRLHASCQRFGFGVARSALEERMLEAAASLPEGAGSLRTTVTRGPGPRGLLPPTEPKPTILTKAAPAGPRSTTPAGAILSSVCRNEGSPASSHKTLGYLDNILARQEAEAAGAEEAIMLTNSGRVACTTIGNLIVLREQGPCLTPAATGGVLPGVVRQVLIEAGLLIERDLTAADLEGAPLARSNSLIGAAPLLLVGGAGWPDWADSVLGRLTAALEEAEAVEP